MSRTRARRHTRTSSTIVIPPPSSLIETQEKVKNDKTKRLLQSSAEGATFLISSQIVSKLLTFILNQLLIRLSDPNLVGLAAQYDILRLSCLFYSREACRLAVQRESSNPIPDEFDIEGRVEYGTESGVAQTLVNMGYIPFIIGLPITLILSSSYFYSIDQQKISPFISTSSFPLSIFLLILSVFIELATEPLFLLLQYTLQYKTRALAESIAVIARSFITLILIFFSSSTNKKNLSSPLPFAIGELAYSIVLMIVYYLNSPSFYSRKLYRIKPKKVYTNNYTRYFWFQPSLLNLLKSIWFQSIFKHLISEGDRIFITYATSISEQGVYALANNYGSLVARIIFAPVEETLRNLFSKLLATSPQSIKNSTLISTDKKNILLDSPIIKTDKKFDNNLHLSIPSLSNSSSSNTPFLTFTSYPSQSPTSPYSPSSSSSPSSPSLNLNSKPNSNSSSTLKVNLSPNTNLHPKSNSNTSSNSTTNTNNTTTTTTNSNSKSDSSQTKNVHSSTLAAAELLGTLIRVYAYLSTAVLVFAPPAVSYFITTFVGLKWQSAVPVLSAYAYLLPTLAYNGMLEAFVSSVASPSDMRKHTFFLAALSIILGALAYCFSCIMKLGARGVVYANAITMVFRIIWSGWYVKTYFAKRGVKINLLKDVSSQRKNIFAGGVVSISIFILVRLLVPFISSLRGLLLLIFLAVSYGSLIAVIEKSLISDVYHGNFSKKLEGKEKKEK